MERQNTGPDDNITAVTLENYEELLQAALHHSDESDSESSDSSDNSDMSPRLVVHTVEEPKNDQTKNGSGEVTQDFDSISPINSPSKNIVKLQVPEETEISFTVTLATQPNTQPEPTKDHENTVKENVPTEEKPLQESTTQSYEPNELTQFVRSELETFRKEVQPEVIAEKENPLSQLNLDVKYKLARKILLQQYKEKLKDTKNAKQIVAQLASTKKTQRIFAERRDAVIRRVQQQQELQNKMLSETQNLQRDAQMLNWLTKKISQLQP